VNTADDEKMSDFRKLNEQFELITCSVSDLFVAMETGVEIAGLYSNHTVSSKLMILDPQENLRLLKESYTLFSQNDLVLGRNLNFFTEIPMDYPAEFIFFLISSCLVQFDGIRDLQQMGVLQPDFECVFGNIKANKTIASKFEPVTQSV